jgi:DNA-binding XRE family transcriptional regulator
VWAVFFTLFLRNYWKTSVDSGYLSIATVVIFSLVLAGYWYGTTNKSLLRCILMCIFLHISLVFIGGGTSRGMKADIPKHHRRVLELLGLYLREMRFSYGLTQQSLHMEAGISRRGIINMEKGRSTNLLHILRLSDFYGIDFVDLLQNAK